MTMMANSSMQSLRKAVYGGGSDFGALAGRIAAALRFGAVVIGITAFCEPVPAVEQQHGVLVGTVADVDAGAKTLLVKAGDGTEHTLLFMGKCQDWQHKPWDRGGSLVF